MSDFARKIADSKWDHPEFMNPRGIGSNGGWISLVTGESVDFGPDMACFVSKEAGERIVKHLDGRAYLDFRPSEPNWVQLKLIVEEEHKPVLVRLYDALVVSEGMIRPRLLAWAIDPVNFPGYEPHALKALRDRREKLETIQSTLKSLLEI